MRSFKGLFLLLALAAPLAEAEDRKMERAAISDISVITAADIAREKPARLIDMLKSRVGLDEKNGYISMRGVEGIAVFVDGFSSSLGGLSSVKPEQVEKVEILRGAASARFGAEAMGGAIAVTTKKTAASALSGRLTLGADSRGGAFARAQASVGQHGWNAALLLEERRSRGFVRVPDSPMPYQITVEKEHGWSRLADLKLGWRSATAEVSANVKRSESWVFLGRPNWFFGVYGDNLRLQGHWQAAPAWRIEAAYGFERSRSPGVRDQGSSTDAAGLAPAWRVDGNNRQQEGTLALRWQGGGWQARLGGLAASSNETLTNRDYASAVAQNRVAARIRKNAVFVSAEGPLGAGRLELEARRDEVRYESFRLESAGPPAQITTGGGVVKSAFSPKAALSWPLDGALGAGYTLRGSAGTGFSPPSTYFLYNRYESQGTINRPNPDLKPERSRTLDFGLSHHGETRQWELTLFTTRWQDKIANRILDYGVPLVQQAQNVGEASARGVEAQWSQRFGRGWSMSANFTYNRTRVVRDLAAPRLVGKQLPDMPRLKANWALAYEPDAGFFGRATLRAVGHAFTDEANTVKDEKGYRWQKPAYALLDLAVSWRRPGWELSLMLDNAFNRDYIQGPFWRGEPRTLRGEFTLRF